jgi:DNA-binding CsgD family transcriptional regulator
MRNIDQYISSIGRAESVGQVVEALGSEISNFGFEWFTYEMIVPPEGPINVFYRTTYPEVWTARYSEQRYGRGDIVVSHAMRTSRPFLWRDIDRHPHLTAAQKIVSSEAADIGLRAGAIVPLHGPGPTKSYVSVANDLPDDHFVRLFMACRHELHIVSTYAHERLVQLGAGTATPTYSLSAREREILTWTATGKTAWEVADRLKISSHTVAEYLDDIKGKLGAKNKAHSVSIGLAHGLIRI